MFRYRDGRCTPRVSKKVSTFFILNNSVKNELILMILVRRIMNTSDMNG